MGVDTGWARVPHPVNVIYLPLPTLALRFIGVGVAMGVVDLQPQPPHTSSYPHVLCIDPPKELPSSDGGTLTNFKKKTSSTGLPPSNAQSQKGNQPERMLLISLLLSYSILFNREDNPSSHRTSDINGS